MPELNEPINNVEQSDYDKENVSPNKCCYTDTGPKTTPKPTTPSSESSLPSSVPSSVSPSANIGLNKYRPTQYSPYNSDFSDNSNKCRFNLNLPFISKLGSISENQTLQMTSTINKGTQTLKNMVNIKTKAYSKFTKCILVAQVE